MGQLHNRSPERFDYASGIASGGCTDIDMLWERNGYFLGIENKRPDENLSLGQLRAFRQLNAQPNWTIWVAKGTPPSAIVSAGPLDGEQHPLNVDQLRKRIQRWWDDHAPEAVAA